MSTLRPADWRDLAAMAALEARCFPDDPWSEGAFWGELARRPRRSYVVAEGEGGAVAGYAGLDLAGDVADVMTVAVDPSRRGQGLGATLLTHLHGEAARAGAGGVMLEVRADNGPARRLYAAHGYTVVHTRRGYYRSDAAPVDAHVMRKELDEHG